MYCPARRWAGHPNVNSDLFRLCRCREETFLAVEMYRPMCAVLAFSYLTEHLRDLEFRILGTNVSNTALFLPPHEILTLQSAFLFQICIVSSMQIF